MTKFEKKIVEAVGYAADGDPLRDFLDDYEIIQALELLVEYIKGKKNK